MLKEFAKVKDLTLDVNNIKVFLFEDLRQTPKLSFTVKELKWLGTIVITDFTTAYYPNMED